MIRDEIEREREHLIRYRDANGLRPPPLRRARRSRASLMQCVSSAWRRFERALWGDGPWPDILGLYVAAIVLAAAALYCAAHQHNPRTEESWPTDHPRSSSTLGISSQTRGWSR